MTFWQFVEHDKEAEIGPERGAEIVARLHAASASTTATWRSWAV
ncbi:hypothetical protein LCL61_04890 [Amycolatopsis coloradensis]|uniref:Uncharacterized protein n=1 Tax=Amycolatopsis coloradensis TaxID=76021 RepID=A0ACD5B6A7_9PSEU